MGNRDNFSANVKRTLANRVGHRCSFFGCNQVTTGPDISNPMGAINSGIAAHITAAADGGPRYDKSLTPQQRSDISNGIWMCEYHAGLIDSHDPAYSAPLLHSWKAQAEARQAAAQELSQQGVDTAYSDRDIRVLKELTDKFNYRYLQMLEQEPFGAKVRDVITTPLYDFFVQSDDPFCSFNSRELESMRVELIGKVKNFWRHFGQHSGGCVGYYDYIDISAIRMRNPDSVDRFIELIYQTQELAQDICRTARKLLEIRARLE
ncbi:MULTISPECIES: hypothetical protein [Citrobacter freundii complex]|uniref:hypothetical protein n=1 Tax=Enterobacteriaceae TaxID=543 RepID=UPI001F602642|nr:MULTISPECIES: hypothetical protein [Citrobacter freundii complex]